MLAETLAGAAMVAAVIFTVCAVRRWLPERRDFPGVELEAVLKCRGDAVGLEAAAREAEDKRTIYIVDMGMTPEARRRAEIIARRRQARIFTKDDWKVLINGR